MNNDNNNSSEANFTTSAITSKIREFFTLSTATWLNVLTAVTVLFLVLMNLFAGRPIGIGETALTNGGVFLIAPVLVIQNIITEVWGKKKVFRITVFAIMCQLFIIGITWLIIAMPTDSYARAAAWQAAFGGTWRIMIASIIAFVIGSVLNIVIFDKIRDRSRDKSKRFKTMFTIAGGASTIVAQLIDSTIFFILAFAPVGITGTFEMGWWAIFTSIMLGTAIQFALELIIIGAIAVHLTKWLKARKT